jgi:hypothetical protein
VLIEWRETKERIGSFRKEREEFHIC